MTPPHLYTRAEWAALTPLARRLIRAHRRRYVEWAAADHERRYGHHLTELADAITTHVR